VAAARPGPGAVVAIAARVRELAEGYVPPTFSEVPGPDIALFLCAIDHRTGYHGRYLVGGHGPFEGSALMWALALRAEERTPGRLGASRVSHLDADELADIFRIGGESVGDPQGRLALWKDLAAGLDQRYGGEVEALISAAGGKLGGSGGLLDRLGEFRAYSDPLQKKSFLFAKIAARRGWLQVADPENWEVCSDNVLMRLALRSGLVAPGPVEEVRAGTRDALKAVASAAGIEPPLLDDLLWELGREDPDLLGTGGGDVMEPPRPEGSVWY
jgi:hypothetical protein